MTRLAPVLAALLCCGCYQAHQASGVRPARDAAPPRDAGTDARAPITVDASRPDAGPPPFECAGQDALARGFFLESFSERAGLRVEGVMGGGPASGVVVGREAGVVQIELDDGRPATFTVAEPSLLDRVSVGQAVEVEGGGAWQRLRAGEVVVAVHVSTVFQVGLPPFETTDGFGRRVDFTLVPRCTSAHAECGPGATSTIHTMLADFEGEPDYHMVPGQLQVRGGIDEWRVHFLGAVRLDGGDDDCPVGLGLHAIVELSFFVNCLC